MILGCALVFIGIGLVGSSGFLNDDPNPDAPAVINKNFLNYIYIINIFNL